MISPRDHERVASLARSAGLVVVLEFFESFFRFILAYL
jgi:hypothetical protein